MNRVFLIAGLAVLCLMPILGAYVERGLPDGAVLKAMRLQEQPKPQKWVY
ncbi:hypothetical protein [Pseudooceanicola sp. HF7]|nr:hypothetical protein [Pseudooceanicola sp. HF7]NIZ10901.1 hypothetical protein [Pseudooceanicola sp. HF7]